MRRIPTSIIHLLGFFGVLLLIIAGSLYTAIGYNYFNRKDLQALLNFQAFSPTCSRPNTPEQQDVSVTKDCQNNGCYLVVKSKAGSPKRLPAISEDPLSPTAGIDNLIYSEKNHIISYTTPSDGLTSRIVLNFDGKLLHNIDETPGINRTLTFAYYHPREDTLVYFDEVSKKTYHYKANGIGLWITDCLTGIPPITP